MITLQNLPKCHLCGEDLIKIPGGEYNEIDYRCNCAFEKLNSFSIMIEFNDDELYWVAFAIDNYTVGNYYTLNRTEIWEGNKNIIASDLVNWDFFSGDLEQQLKLALTFA